MQTFVQTSDLVGVLAKATQLGSEHGKNAASWFFDGNTDTDTYRRILKGLEDGDPEILDSLPRHGLSGEMTDEFSSRDLKRELDIQADRETVDFGEVCDAYEAAFTETSRSEIVRVATYHTAGVRTTLDGIPHADYPHEPGRLYDCPACENECFCTGLPGDTQCVFCALLQEA